MRSLLALVVPALLSLHLVACATEESSEPNQNVVQNQLVQAGGACTKNSDCASSACNFGSGITTKGLPMPEGEPIGDDDDDNNNNNSNNSQDPNVKGKPAPQPTPADRGRPDPSAGPTPQADPSPAASGTCAG